MLTSEATETFGGMDLRGDYYAHTPSWTLRGMVEIDSLWLGVPQWPPLLMSLCKNQWAS